MLLHLAVKDDANVEVAHFIIEGEVSIIQRLIVFKYRKKNDERNKIYYKLSKKQDLNVKNYPKLESIYMQVCHLLKGATFGLGKYTCLSVGIYQTVPIQKDLRALT